MRRRTSAALAGSEARDERGAREVRVEGVEERYSEGPPFRRDDHLAAESGVLGRRRSVAVRPAGAMQDEAGVGAPEVQVVLGAEALVRLPDAGVELVELIGSRAGRAKA